MVVNGIIYGSADAGINADTDGGSDTNGSVDTDGDAWRVL